MQQHVARIKVNTPVAWSEEYGYSVAVVQEFFLYPYLTSTEGEEPQKPFQGCTGSTFRPVLKAEYEQAMTEEEKRDYYEEIWRSVVADNGTDKGLDEWADQIGDDEYEESRFDPSYSECHDDVRTVVLAAMREQGEDTEGHPEDVIPAVACEGGGRMFPLTGQWTMLNYDLYNLVSAWEAGGMTSVERLTARLDELSISYTVSERA
jgi:hypothetical protein